MLKQVDARGDGVTNNGENALHQEIKYKNLNYDGKTLQLKSQGS